MSSDTPASGTPRFLSDPALELIIFGGKGGVGKTNCASAAAIALARSQPGRTFTLVSTDPAHSVRDAIHGSALPTNLRVLEIDAPAEHDAFMKAHQQDLAEVAARGTFLDRGDIDNFLQLSLPGLDELMVFLHISTSVHAREQDCIIIDTAPTGHALRLLEMPDFLGRWMEAMDALLAKHRYMISLFGRRAAAPDHLDEFLDGLRETFDATSELLKDRARCTFVPVMLAESLSVAETGDLVRRLEELDIPLSDVIVNRLIPETATSAPLRALRSAQASHLRRLPPELTKRAIWGLPLLADEVLGVDAMANLYGSLIDPVSLADREAARVAVDEVGPAIIADPPRVHGTVALPSAENLRLVLLTGKGGVGKTTMSCAAASAVAQAAGRNVVIVSTDPAHSLGDALAMSLGPTPALVDAAVAPTLRAMELDAASEMESLRTLYAGMLEGMLERMFGSADATFDRDVLERLLDLSPPGLDEVMALTKVVELLESGVDTLVLDTAPTGHALRLLQLPVLVEQWLQSIFAVLLKYQKVIRLPKLQARLVQISKGVKKLRALLEDPARCCILGVAIPTELALAETGDLVEACSHTGVGVSSVIINQVTPPPAPGEAQDALLASVNARELAIIARLRAAHPSLAMAVVERRTAPSGLRDLAALGSALFAQPAANKLSPAPSEARADAPARIPAQAGAAA
ncbi:MAG: ArsA family ATPase [Phycisphaerales bacterium]|jgi:arsenite-transporting ATPase|nr:ArsA family ATPase [Phycisphaeraceae bacterium]